MAQTLTDVFDIRIQFPIDLRMVKGDINARNAIETLQRYEGLAVWVVSEQKLYRLVGGITNDDWVDQTPANSGLQAVTVSTSAPTGGNPGDIHFRNVSGGTEVWYNEGGTWGSKGTIPSGGPTYTPDGALPTGAGFLAYLRTNYTNAKVGDVVYREGTTQLIKCTCYYVDANPSLNKWSKITEIIE